MEKFIPKLIHCLLNEKQIPVYGDGKNVRDWIFVDDHCRAIELVYNKADNGEIFTIGGGCEYSNIELIDKIYSIINEIKPVSKKISFVEDRFGHDRRYSISNEKIYKKLGFKIENSFNKNIKKYIINILQEIDN